MACFIIPTTEAIVTTAAKKLLDKKGETNVKIAENAFVKRLGRLNAMLWGGSALLAFEHVWHGEVVPFFPFLTNAATPESAAEMLREMATSGVAMALLVTAAWAVSVGVSVYHEKKNAKAGENA